MTTVLVMDGEQRASLAVVRSLGRAGFTPVVCSHRSHSLAAASRYVADAAVVADSRSDSDGFLRDVAQLVERWRPVLALPITETSVAVTLHHLNRLPGVRIPFPSAAVFDRARDKAGVLREARAIGMTVPKQVLLETSVSGSALAGLVTDLRCPLVVKPTSSVAPSGAEATYRGPRYAADPAQLQVAVSAFSPSAYPLLVQERIVGPGLGVFFLRWEGKILARFAHRRLREKPPAGGRSVYCESVMAPAELMRQAETLVERLGWEGVAMVEFKADAATGRPYLMEVNPRFWGSLQLAIDAGVDFPALLVRAALGETVTQVSDYRVGVRSKWWWGNVDYAWTRLRRSNQFLALPRGATGRWRSIWDAMMWRPGDRNEILRWYDPGPAVRETLDWLLRR